MIADRQHAEEELGAEQVQVDAAVAAAVVEDVVEDVAKDVAYVATPSPLPHDIPSPPQQPSLPPQEPHVTPPALTQGEAFPATFQQRLELVKLKARVKKLEPTDKVKSSKFRRLRKVGASRQVESFDDMKDVFNQGRMMNEDEGIELEDDSEVQDMVEVVTTAKLITEVVTTAASQVSAVSTTIPAAKPSIPAAAPTVVAAYTIRRKRVTIRDPEEELPLKTPTETPKVKDKGKGILVEAPKPMKKKDQIEMDAEYARNTTIPAASATISVAKLSIPAAAPTVVAAYTKRRKGVTIRDPKEELPLKTPAETLKYIKRYQGMKKRPQTESEARNNMMIYLKNTAGYKIDFLKGMTYAQICPIFQARFDENI
nr:hypothetical protein [Tanacetum cinerariifolium]